MNTSRRCITIVVIVGTVAVSAASEVLFTVADLGASHPNPGVGKYFINNEGQVVGGKDETAYLWSDGSTKLLKDYPGGGIRGVPSGINDRGQVVGTCRRPVPFGWVWDSTNGMQDLGIQGNYVRANDINNNGQVVGDIAHAFLWDEDNGTEHLVFPGAPYSDANAINDSGQVVGMSQGGRVVRAFIWDADNGMRELGGISSASDHTVARDINSHGQIVGNIQYSFSPPSCDPNPACSRATLWNTVDEMIELGVLPTDLMSVAIAINDAGQVVGWGVGKSRPNGRAFLWDQVSGMRELEDLLHPSISGWSFIRTLDINKSGQITGTGLYDGDGNEATPPDPRGF